MTPATQSADSMRSHSSGRGLRFTLIAVGLTCAGIALGLKALKTSQLRAEVELAAREAQSLYEGFRKFEEHGGAYPNSFLTPAFELDSAEPLRRRGYYRGQIQSRIANGRFDDYDAPDDRGLNKEFWLEMTLAVDPSVRLLVVRSDDAPLSGGEWLDGVYLVRRNGLEKL